MSTRRVLVVSGDTLPLENLPTSGAGLRAWGLAKGLEARGHEVRLLMPEKGIEKALGPVDLAAARTSVYDHLDPYALNQHVTQIDPDVVVFQHWPASVPWDAGLGIPMVIDFHGPLILETLYQNRGSLASLHELKIRAIAQADYFTCAGELQRHYYYAWLLLGGVDLRETPIDVIPVSVDPVLPEHVPAAGDPCFVFGGTFLPWQDPSLALHTLVDELERRGRGILRFFGGPHPHIRIPPGKYADLLPRLRRSPCVRIEGIVPNATLVREYRRSHVAIDLMRRNPERELAFTTRTVEYLWCGLPVIYNDYAELAPLIRSYDAGWTLDAEDSIALRATLDQIFADPEQLQRKSLNAQRLVRERLTWDRTIEPLDRFCRDPHLRRKKTSIPAPSAPLPSIPVAPNEAPARSTATTTAELENYRAQIRMARRRPKARLAAWGRELTKRVVRVSGIARLLGRHVSAHRPLLAGKRVGRSFLCPSPNLCGIEVQIGTYKRTNSCELVLTLIDESDGGRQLAQVRQDALGLRDGAFCAFSFPPITHSAGRRLRYWIESPDATIADCVTVLVDPQAPPRLCFE